MKSMLAAVVLAPAVIQPGVAHAGPGVTVLSDTVLDRSALYFVSYDDGLMNQEQDPFYLGMSVLYGL